MALTHALTTRLRNDSLLRNSVFMMSSTVATSAIGYLYWVIAARIYSAHDIGLASAFISAMTLTSIFVSMGIGSTLVQLLPRREAGYARSLTLFVCLMIGTLTSLLGGTIVAVVLPYLSSQFADVPYRLAYTLIFIIGTILCTVATLLDQTFVAERAANNMAVRNTAFALIKLAIMVLLVQAGALGVFSSWVLSLAATVILGGFVLLPRLKRGYHLATRGVAEQIRPVLASFAGHHFINIGGILPMYLLPVFVSVRLSVTDNAYFYTTWMMGSLFLMVSPSVAAALFSEGSHTASDMRQKVRASLLIISVLLGPTMLIFFLGGRFIMAVFGPAYPEHGLSLLMLLTISAVPDAITNIYVSLLRVQGRLRQAALLNLGMATITLALAWVLLPRMGIAGAGCAWLIAQSMGSLLVGGDILISRHYKSGTLVSRSDEREVYSSFSEGGYLNAEAISFVDTAVLPIVGRLSNRQNSREEAISLIDTLLLPIVRLSSTQRGCREEGPSLMDISALPTKRLPSTYRSNREKVISLIDTSVLSTVKLPFSNQTNREATRTTDTYQHSQLFRTHKESSCVEEEMR